MKKPEDFPEFRAAREKLRALEAELQQKQERKRAIQSEADTASPATRAAFHQSWREEFEQIDRGEPLLLEQIEIAKQELSEIRGRLSLQICQEARPVFVQHIKRVLQALKQLSDVNEKLDWMRHELEATGVQTGSIPHCIFTGIGTDRWSDERAGRIVGFQRWIRENFPELKDDTY